MEETVADSLAAILARKKFGMAMAAIIKITATTTSNSIKEKPRDLRGLSDSTAFRPEVIYTSRLSLLASIKCAELRGDAWGEKIIESDAQIIHL
jgi:hypothetical protein